MTNLTLSIDDDLLKKARIRALEHDTSVNTLVRDYLESFVAHEAPPTGMRGFLVLTEATRASSGSLGRAWTRDELYEQ
jgi:plasmid stability protein